MKKSNLVLIVLVLAAAGFFLWAWGRPGNQPPVSASGNPQQAAATAATASGFETKTDSSGWAEVEVTPLTLASSEWSFGITLNAHQEMDVDIIKAVTLTDNNGDTLMPLRWDEPNPGGHHRKGTLVFAAPPSATKNIILTMTGVGGAETRIFTWNLP